MASQVYNNNNVLLFSLQIWKQPYRIKRSDQARVSNEVWALNEFWASAQGKYKALGQCVDKLRPLEAGNQGWYDK